ncbi:MAG TPA: ATP-binding protein, partial [Gemmataceae bacterium]|nr:ATP-binding protein [Gemmataceae bacterium]
MACSWRIRHKLILGMSLIAAVMALLLGGTLHGLETYRASMGIYESKLEELKLAVDAKETIRKLQFLNTEPRGQNSEIRARMKPIKEAIDAYDVKLHETIDRGRAPFGGKQELLLVDLLNKDLVQLDLALKKDVDTPSVGHVDLLDRNSEVGKTLKLADEHVDDLVGTITKVFEMRVDYTRNEVRKSIIILITTGVGSLLLMIGLLRYFYRWIATPIRELADGVSKVAHGNFQHRIEIHSADEIEDLAKAYNEMTEKLRAMYENLAQQVNERSRQLVRSERLAGVGFLAAGVAHEINNPLAAILFSSEALEVRLAELLVKAPMGSQDRETIAKYLKMIQEEAERCKEITQKLLAFSRGGERKREETDLTTVVQGVLDVVQHLPSSKGKRIQFQGVGPMRAWVNAQEVKQVFLNLVINALESMEDGGNLTISQAMRDGVVELTFKDTGCGMTPDILENIFEPFFTRSRTGKGTGLGLSISHR